MLTLIAVILGVIALKPLLDPEPGHAQASGPRDLYIEPGVHSIHAPDGSADLIGKIMVDTRNGNIWGFPTNSKAPYPIDTTRTQPPVSKPIFLGKFDFSALDRQ